MLARNNTLDHKHGEFEGSKMIHRRQPDHPVFPLSHGPHLNVSICVNAKVIHLLAPCCSRGKNRGRANNFQCILLDQLLMPLAFIAVMR